MSSIDALSATPLGTMLSPGETAELSQNAVTRNVGRGTYLFRAGDPGGALYVVLKGSLDVVLGQPASGETVVASLGIGQIAGELEAMTRSLRVASLVATEDATVLEIQAGQLENMLQTNRSVATKLVLLIAKTLARRLAAVNQMILARTPKPAAPEPARPEPEEIEEADVLTIGEDDLDVLDKIWS
jgi:CRP-like cAMP-binding protein